MRNPLKFNSKSAKLLWLSDLHDFHQPSWHPTPYESRGFASAQEHHDWFMASWAKHVDADTIVFNIGDVAFNDAEGKRFDVLASLFAKEHYLLNGNHLSGMKWAYRKTLPDAGVNPDKAELYPLKYRNITFMGGMLHVFIDGISVYMQHYAPYVWPELSSGGYALCGHSHGNCPELNPANVTQGRVLDIGIDNAVKYNGSPFFSWEEIKKIMDRKPIVKRDHH
jgi:calcineurin-like phosphoesterase family protein